MGNVAAASCFLSRVVRVVHPNGKVFIYTQPITIAELLLAYPHHYVCDIHDGSNPKGKMLPLEMELELGHTYSLVPLPRLFNTMRSIKRPEVWSCIPAGLCLQASLQSIPVVSDSENEDEDELPAHRRRKGRVTLGSLLALESGCTGLIKRSYQGQDASRSHTTLQMQRILETAEMHWRHMCQGSRAWRPELESIKEESRKSISSSPLHELNRQAVIRSNSINSSLKPTADSVQR